MKAIPELEAVTPTDEFMVFTVESQSTPGTVYRVDKTLWFGSGSCSCEQFSCRIQPRLGKNDWTPPTTCKHLALVDRWIAVRVAQTAIEQRQGSKRYDASEPNL